VKVNEMISRPQRIDFYLSILSFLLAIVIFIIALTEKSFIQIIVLQPLYSILDKTLLLFRSLIFLVFSLAGIVVLSRKTQTHKKLTHLGRFVTITLLGLLASLIIFYAFSCCDSPVIFFMGFPFSWFRGLTQAQHYLPLPAFQYLIINYSKIDWGIDAFSLITNMFFWHNVFLLLDVLQQQNWLGPQKHRIP